MTKLGGYYGSPQWSRDGRRIVCYDSNPRAVYNRLEADPEIAKTVSSQIVSVEVATGAIERHTTGPGVKVSPRYADGGDIAYVALYGRESGRAMGGREHRE